MARVLRTNEEMGRAAQSAQTAPARREGTGVLSDEEATQVPHNEAWIALYEGLLYEHLATAGRERQRMQRLGNPNQASERVRQHALERARQIYEELVGEGWKPDGLLAQMMLAERA
jgi:hypothetical protein